METIRVLLLISLLFSGLGLVFGLWKPWLALWWLPMQNRLLVLRYYGLICLFSVLLYGLIVLVSNGQ